MEMNQTLSDVDILRELADDSINVIMLYNVLIHPEMFHTISYDKLLYKYTYCYTSNSYYVENVEIELNEHSNVFNRFLAPKVYKYIKFLEENKWQHPTIEGSLFTLK